MKTFRSIAAAFVFAAIFAVSASAQAPAAQPNANYKIVVINTVVFDSKDGITKYVSAMNTLEKEFETVETEIKTMATKYQALGKEIENLQKQAQNVPAGGQVPFDPKTAQTKVEEYQNMELAIKRKQEDAKARFERRQPQIMGPILQDIGKAMQDFAKQKGYALILDGSKLEQANLILAFDETKADVTKEFIAFYNTRPATAAVK